MASDKKVEVVLDLDKKRFTSGIAGAGREIKGLENRTSGFGARFGGVMKTVGKAALVAGAAVAAAGVAVGAAMIKATMSATEYGVAVDKMSKQTGISAEAVSRLGYAAQQEHASMEGLSTGIKKLARTMSDAKDGGAAGAEAFAKLGLSAVDANGGLKKTDDMLLEIADKFKVMTDDTEKAALAQELFGRSGMELIPFLEMGRSGIEELGKEADELGITLDATSAGAFKRFDDKLTKLKGSFKGAGIIIGEQLIEPLGKLADALSESLTGFMKSDAMKGAIAGIGRALELVIPKLVSFVGKALKFLETTGIFELFGDLLKSVLDIASDLFDVLLAALEPVITALVDGLKPILPVLTKAIDELFKAIEPLLPVLGELLADFLEAILPILPPLIESITEVIKAITPIMPIVADILAVAGKVVTFIYTVWGGAVGYVLQALGWIIDKFNVFGIIGDTFTAVWDLIHGNMTRAVKKMLSLISGLLDGLSHLPLVGGKFADMRDQVDAAINGIDQSIEDMTKSAGEHLRNLMTSSEKTLIGSTPKLKDKALMYFQQILEAQAQKHPLITGSMQTIMDQVRAAIAGLDAKEITLDKMTEIVSTIVAQSGLPPEAMQAIMDEVKGTVAETDLKTPTTSMISSGLIGGINEQKPSVVGTMAELMEQVQATVNGTHLQIKIGAKVPKIKLGISGDKTSTEAAIDWIEFHGGGMVRGRRRDVPVMAEAGEYILRKEAVRLWGKGYLDALNRGGGAMVGAPAAAVAVTKTAPVSVTVQTGDFIFPNVRRGDDAEGVSRYMNERLADAIRMARVI